MSAHEQAIRNDALIRAELDTKRIEFVRDTVLQAHTALSDLIDVNKTLAEQRRLLREVVCKVIDNLECPEETDPSVLHRQAFVAVTLLKNVIATTEPKP